MPHARLPAPMAHARYLDRNSSGERSEDAPDRAIAALAERQHGIVAHPQLHAVGLNDDAISYRLRLGRLQPFYRAVYAVGHRPVTREARWMAAVLAGGTEAALSHRSAGALWEMLGGGGAPVDVTLARSRRSRHGIRFHRSPLPPDEVTCRDGIPVTTVPRTLFDLAAVLRPRELERALNEAEVQRLWDTLSLEHLLVRYPRRPGSRAVRALLKARRAGAKVTRSDFEMMFLEFVDRTGLPEPETNQWIEGFKVDVVWREHRLIVELDGYRTHSTRAAFEKDRDRSRVLQSAGWRCVPVTWRQLQGVSRAIARDLRRMLAEGPGATVFSR